MAKRKLKRMKLSAVSMAVCAVAAFGLAACGSSGSNTTAGSGGGSGATTASNGAGTATSGGSSTTGGSSSSIPLPADVKKSGELNIGAFLGYPPYRYIDSSGQPAGIEVQQAQAVAKVLGVKAVFHNISFAALFPAVQNRRYDFGLGANVQTTSREKILDMMPYEYTALVLVVQKGNPDHISASDLCRSDLTFGDTVSTVNIDADHEIANQCKQEGKPVPKVLTFQDVPTRNQALLNGHTNIFTDDPAVDTYEINKQHLAYEILPDSSSLKVAAAKPEAAGWEFPKGDKPMETAVLDAIKVLIKNGTWQKIMKDGGITKPIIPPSFHLKSVPG